MPIQGDIVRQISSARDLDELWKLAVAHFTSLGFAEVSYILLQRGQPERPLAVFIHGDTLGIHETYKDLGYAQHDPAARYAMHAGKPFNVDQLPQLTNFTRQEAATFRKLQEVGARNVLILPVFGPQAANGLVALGRPTEPDLPERLNWEELQAIGQLMHLRALTFQPDEAQAIANPLSERELEILRWVAQGKSNSVIATILDISAGTVDTYLRRIFEKLEVGDRTAAAVRGVSYGLIRA